MTAADLEFGTTEIPQDTTPNVDSTPPMLEADNASAWFDPQYPYSTKEYPYGFFDNADGTPDFDRPRKRRPKGTGGGSSKNPASGKGSTNARSAAKMLAQMNMLLGMGLRTFGMPMTAEMLAQANTEFEAMAFDALSNDPALCRKILSAGAASGKTQLLMAYLALGVAVAPPAYMEIKAKRENDHEYVG